MNYQSFIKEVMERGHLENRQQAETAARATLEVLGQRLFGGEAADLAAQLPRELAGALTGQMSEKFDLEEFLRRVAEREGVDRQRAKDHVAAVLTVMEKFVSLGELSNVRSQLPAEFDQLFGFGPGRTRH